MGTVWLADHLTLGVRCAVKFMTVEATRDPNYRARFELEARAVAQLHSANVVRVLDYDVCDGVPFIAMESLRGEDLGARLRRVGRLDARATHRIISQVAHGLTSAHAAGIIHRDLKPENIFLAEEFDDEVAKLLDFGIAKMPSVEGVDSGTQAGTVLGTPAYMSPEQAREVREIDYRSDLWSLAIIAYECLSGQLPFDGPSLGEIFARIMFEPIPVPSQTVSVFSRTFDRWWERATSRDVDGRFTSARELSDELGRALGLLDARASRAELASSRSVAPPSHPARRRSYVPAAVIGLTASLAVFVLPSVRIDPSIARAEIGNRVRSAANSIAQSTTGWAAPRLVQPAPNEVPMVSVSSVSADPLPRVAESPKETLRVVAPLESAPVPSTPPTSSHEEAAKAPAPHRAVPPKASTPESPELSPVNSLAGAECAAGQHRCEGRQLEVCNSTLDGWTQVRECGDVAVCDATGAGQCVPVGSEVGLGQPPATSESSEPNPY
jgi:serine/threonine protein kinase